MKNVRLVAHDKSYLLIQSNSSLPHRNIQILAPVFWDFWKGDVSNYNFEDYTSSLK